MKKNISIELLGDRMFAGKVQGVNLDSGELLQNNSFSLGNTGSSPYAAGISATSNYATDWDLDTQSGTAIRQWTWNSSGWLQKTGVATGSKFMQHMTLGAGVIYTCEVRFKNYNRCGSLALTAQGQEANGSSVPGANVVICDPSNSPPHGLGYTTGAFANPNVGYGGGRPNNSTGTIGDGVNPPFDTWHTSTVVWRQANNFSTDRLGFHTDNCTEITIDYVKLSRVDMNQSVILGTLDGANPEDFPLSLTYSINSATNIEARAGAFSKTFQIPATANNNQVLKRMNIANSIHNNMNLGEDNAPGLRFKMPCRISAGEVFAIYGLFQVQDITRIKDRPVAYSCVFYGDNLTWSTLLENRMLHQIEFQNATGLKVSAKNIIESWEADDGATKTSYDPAIGTVENTSPIVYPFASYGPTNETGEGGTMQLLREYWEAYYPTASTAKNGCYYYEINPISYTPSRIDATPLPVLDWRPMVWIYQMIHAIFKSVGYIISSSFIESNEFKRLLYATPNANHTNPDERFQTYSSFNDFNDTSYSMVMSNISFAVTTGSGFAAIHVDYQWPDWFSQVGYPCAAGTYYALTGADGAIGPSGYIGDGSSGNPWEGPPATIIEWILVDANRFQSYVNNATFVTHAPPIGGDDAHTYWTIGESGYYKLELENYCVNYSGGGFTHEAPPYNEQVYLGGGAGIGVKVKGIGNTTWDTLVIEQNLSPPSWTDLTNTSAFHSFTGSNTPINSGWYKQTQDMPKCEFEGYFNKGDQLKLFMRIDWRIAIKVPAAHIAVVTHAHDINMLVSGTDYDSIHSTSFGYNQCSASLGVFNITLLNPSRLEYGSTYDLANIIPTEHTQIDFIKGLAHCFNLQFQTNEATKTVYIEPFSEFYRAPHEAIDWTSKLDRSKEVVDAFIDSEFTRRVIFKYKTDDKDAMVKEIGLTYFDGVEDNYPYIQYLSNSYPAGDTVFENPFFSGTWDCQHFANKRSGHLNFCSAAMWETINQEAKGYEFAPRILLYTKKDFGSQNLAITDMDRLSVNNKRGWDGQWWALNALGGYDKQYHAWLGWADVTNNPSGVFPPAFTYNASVVPAEYHAWGDGYNWMYANVPQCGVADRWEFTNQFALTYGNYNCQDYEFDGAVTPLGGPVYGPVGLGLGLYHRYYKSMIDNLIEQPKMRTAYIDLKVSDILKLDFSIPINIDGIYYKLLKVIDYQPHFNTSTEVELHQYNPAQGAGIPQNAVWISTSSVGGGVFDIDDTAPMPTGPLPY